jgi:hypothetical protein
MIQTSLTDRQRAADRSVCNIDLLIGDIDLIGSGIGPRATPSWPRKSSAAAASGCASPIRIETIEGQFERSKRQASPSAGASSRITKYSCS